MLIEDQVLPQDRASGSCVYTDVDLHFVSLCCKHSNCLIQAVKSNNRCMSHYFESFLRYLYVVLEFFLFTEQDVFVQIATTNIVLLWHTRQYQSIAGLQIPDMLPTEQLSFLHQSVGYRQLLLRTVCSTTPVDYYKNCWWFFCGSSKDQLFMLIDNHVLPLDRATMSS